MGHQSRSAKDYTPADDYYTPKWLFDALGLEFDIDVCAPEAGVPWLPTKSHFHMEMDGLAQEWNGRVWMNPPYSLPRPWIEKFIEHDNGIALLPFSRSKMFIEIWNHADAVMTLPSNFKFEHRDHGTKGVFMPTALFALGQENADALRKSEINRVR
jgi:hypothetical protein